MWGFRGWNIKPNSTIVMLHCVQQTVRYITLLPPDWSVQTVTGGGKRIDIVKDGIWTSGNNHTETWIEWWFYTRFFLHICPHALKHTCNVQGVWTNTHQRLCKIIFLYTSLCNYYYVSIFHLWWFQNPNIILLTHFGSLQIYRMYTMLLWELKSVLK